MVFLLGSVSASWNFDNKLFYSEKGLKVNFKNSFGLGKDLGTAELKSHKSVTEVKKVGLGNQVPMFYDFDFNELQKNGLGKVTFTDMRTGEEVEREYKFIYWGDVEVDDYENKIIGYSNNGTAIYESVKVGSHFEKDWIDYNLGIHKKGQEQKNQRNMSSFSTLMLEDFKLYQKLNHERVKEGFKLARRYFLYYYISDEDINLLKNCNNGFERVGKIEE